MKISRQGLPLYLFFIACLLPISAQAFDRAQLSKDPELRQWLYGGVNGGVSSVSPDTSTRESDKDGYQLGGRILISKYWTNWLADVGLGYMYNQLDGNDRFSLFPNAKVQVRTRAGFVEVSPRYRLSDRWQIGLVTNLLFGSDVSFDERVGQASNVALLAGPRVNYEWGGEWLRFRVGVQAQVDVTIGQRQVTWLQGDFQIGIPFGGEPETSHGEVLPAPSVTLPKRVATPKFAEFMPEAAAVKIYLGEAVLRFETNRSDLRPESREILTKVAKYLKRSPKAWEKMRLEGHSDKRGRLAYNDALSLKRAQTVAKEMRALGIGQKRMASQGFGPRRPVDPAEDLEAYALNRRVEIWLDGVKNPDQVTRDLNELN